MNIREHFDDNFQMDNHLDTVGLLRIFQSSCSLKECHKNALRVSDSSADNFMFEFYILHRGSRMQVFAKTLSRSKQRRYEIRNEVEIILSYGKGEQMRRRKDAWNV